MLTLANADLAQRRFDAFDAMYASALDDRGPGHLDELLATAADLVPDLVDGLEKGMIADLERAVREDPIGAEWRKNGITSKALAEQLYNTSHGLKRRGATRAQYREGMRTIIRLICR